MSNLTLNFNTDGYVNDLQTALLGHLADLRNVLRAVDGGSFVEKATTGARSDIVQFALADADTLLSGAGARATANCVAV